MIIATNGTSATNVAYARGSEESARGEGTGGAVEIIQKPLRGPANEDDWANVVGTPETPIRYSYQAPGNARFRLTRIGFHVRGDGLAELTEWPGNNAELTNGFRIFLSDSNFVPLSGFEFLTDVWPVRNIEDLESIAGNSPNALQITGGGSPTTSLLIKIDAASLIQGREIVLDPLDRIVWEIRDTLEDHVIARAFVIGRTL